MSKTTYSHVPVSTPASRQKELDQMNANLAADGLSPDAADLALQRNYVAGTASVADLLKHAQDSALAASGASK